MDRGAWRAAVHGATCLSTSLHEGGGGWVVSDKLVELKKKDLEILKIVQVLGSEEKNNTFQNTGRGMERKGA